MYVLEQYITQGYRLTCVHRPNTSAPRALRLAKAYKIRTKRARKQYVPGNPPRYL